MSPRKTAVDMLIHRIWTGVIGKVDADQDGCQDHQGLAEVGGQRPDDELDEVVEDAAPFLDGGPDRGEVVVGEDHVGTRPWRRRCR